jgi:hypothetical protein
VRRAVAPRRLELELDLPEGVELQPLVRQRRPGDVATRNSGAGGCAAAAPARRCGRSAPVA